MAEAAKRAEAIGFSSVSVSDHSIVTTGSESDGLGSEWPDWSVLSTYLALQTTTIRILSCVVIPYRTVFPLAKQIATVDQVSNGRFTLAAACGWLRPEFAMLRVEHAERDAITDEYLRAMKILWTEERPRFEGRYVAFRDIVFEPKCLQHPHVPIWIAGGTGPKPRRRLLELGDGWMPMGGGLDAELRDTVARIRDEALDAGRDPDAITLRYTIGVGRANAALASISKSIAVDDPAAVGRAESPADVAAAVADFENAGFSELAINFSGESASEVLEQLEWFGAEVMPLL
jgi:probable F420-dependent oxidoreductase